MRRIAGAVLAGLVLSGVAACSKSPTPGGAQTQATTSSATLPFEGSPSQAVLAQAAGLQFPASIVGYRSVRVATDELDVSFTIAAADLDAFVTDSNLGTLTAGKRIITHPSPVWDLNPSGPVQSAVSTRHGIKRGIEVVASPSDPTTDTVRLVVARA